MDERQFNPLAGVLAWLWPGLGHIILGERRRGVYIMIGVLFLFVGGVLIGGIDSIDRRDDRLWFLAQGLNGPLAFGVDWLNQNQLKNLPHDQRILTIGINKPNETGTLFSALGGLMNLIVILDAMFYMPRPASPQVERRRVEDPKSKGVSP
jgi:hypothetical protein